MFEKTAAFTLTPRSPRGRAVLLLHGFTGSPWELRALGESLADRGFDVTAPRLPGHGASPEAMQYVTWRDWVGEAEHAFRALAAKHQHVSIGGLSMGGLLGLLLAAREPRRVRRLLLMAPVVRLRGRGGRFLQRVRHTPLVKLIPPWLEKGEPDLEDDEARADAPKVPRFPLARVLDLLSLQDLAWLSAPAVRCPTLIYCAVNDHVVDPRGIEALHAQLPTSRLVHLQRGFHLIPRDLERARVISEAAEFFDDPTGP